MASIAFPLRARILSLLFLGVALFGTANAWVFRSLMFHSLDASLAAQGVALSTLVAEESTPFLLHRDHLGLAHFLASYQNRYAGIEYVVVYDAQGEVTTSTFPGTAPTFLARSRNPEGVVRFRAGKLHFQDFSAPILGGTLGSVRMGLAETDMRAHVATGERVILGMVLLFLACGVGGSLLIAQSVNRDAVRLSAAVEAFHLEGPMPPLPVQRRDELGLVARAVQDMMGRLQELQKEHLALLARFQDTDRMSSVGLIASGLAHDINNPLSGLIASLERMVRNPGDEARIVAYLPSMVLAARHIQSVIENLLQFVRYQHYAERPVDLPDAIQKAHLLARHRFPKGVDLSIEVAPGLPAILFDPVCLLQILVNILINAADAMQGRAGQLRLQAVEASGCVTLSLMDRGHGMPPEVLARAFDPLFTTKPPGEGTGLGLAIARQLMRDHGGEITLASEPGVGTTVRLTFREATS